MICVLLVLQISIARQLPWPAPAWYSQDSACHVKVPCTVLCYGM